jgi:translation elongation factor EF-Tu-like GTPase
VFRLTVEDVFVIRNRGVVATGRVESGVLRVGDVVAINGVGEARVDAIEVFRKSIDEATVGDNIGVLFRNVGKDQLGRSAELTAAGEAPPIESTGFTI